MCLISPAKTKVSRLSVTFVSTVIVLNNSLVLSCNSLNKVDVTLKVASIRFSTVLTTVVCSLAICKIFSLLQIFE